MKLFAKAFTGAALVALFSVSPVVSAAELYKPAPDVYLDTLDGEGSGSLYEHMGKVVYLDFWASWCGPCRQSLPLLNKLYNKKKDECFEVIAVNLDEDRDAGLEFLDSFPVDYTVLYDPASETPELYNVMGMPTSVLIDREGVVRYIHKGFKPSDMKKIKKEVDKLLKEPVK